VVSTLLTGGIGLLKLDAQWLAVKEAAIPALIGLAVLGSNWTSGPLIRILVFNPTLFEGQIEGSLHMGLGYAISEDLPMEGGHFKSTRLRQCGILRAKEMPEMEVIGVEVPDLYGPYGAKGVGEIGLVPTAGAVANALYQFDGVRRTKLPMAMPKKRRAS
jgi:hypothetical protein